MVAEVFAGLGALKTAFDIARGIRDLDDTTKRNAAVIDLQQTILTAQQAQSALLEEMDSLKKENATMKEWRAEKDNYQLTSIGDVVFVYKLKPSIDSEPAHPLCPNCFADGKKSILQKHETHVGRWTVLACSRCGSEVFPNGGGHSPKTTAGTFGRGR
jgi:hypothetical protein